MRFALPQSRLVRWLALGVVVLTLTLLALRALVAGFLVNGLLRLGGAAEIHFTITEASPWRVVIEDLGFKIRTQEFAARRILIERRHWWLPSLGAITVEAARVPYTIDGSDVSASSWATYDNGQARVEPLSVPLETITVDGQLVVLAAAQPAQALTVNLSARQTAARTWAAQVRAEGPGLSVIGEGSYDQAKDIFDFKVPSASLELATWQGFVGRILILPGGQWELGGQLTASAEGRLVGKTLTAGGLVRWREGVVRYAPQAVVAQGIEADLVFTDLAQMVSSPGRLLAREIQVGKLTLRDVQAQVAFADANRLVVHQASLLTLGGRIAAEPFKYFLDRRELEAVLLADGIDVEAVLALTDNLPAQAKGRVEGRLPIRLDETGLRLGTGWLALKPGVYAELRLNAEGLLTGGVSPRQASYPVLKKVESGLLKLQLGTLRLDIRPPDAPPGRSAQLHLEGTPVDPEVKAPVILDLNVNGPIERLLSLGLDSRRR